MKFKKIAASSAALASLLVFASTAFAHVVVSPKEVGVGKFQSFGVGVPVEKEVATVGLRLVIPESLASVTPNVKPGWKIEFKKVKTGQQVADHHGEMVDEERISEIIWTGGTIPAGQRDDFMFSAKVPAEAGAIQWKAYQTYADGSVVAWDASPQAVADQKKAMDEVMKKDPNMKADEVKLNPYSETKVVNDLTAAASSAQTTSTPDDIKSATRNSKVALVVGVVGLLLGTFAVSKKSS